MINLSRFEHLISSWTEFLEKSAATSLDITKKSMWNLIDWRLEQAPQNRFQIKFQDRFLSLRVEMFASLHSQQVDDGNSHLEESELVTDIQTVSRNHMHPHRIRESGDHAQNTISDQISRDSIFTSSDILYRGHIDIILHPLYLVPCPYIQLFDSKGQPLTADHIQLLIRSFRLEMCTGHNDCAKCETIGNTCDKEAKCSEDEKFLEYLYEEHPYTLTPCLCLHVCGLGASLALIDSTNTISNNYENRSSNLRATDGNATYPTVDLYLLSWFTLVGPAIGINVDMAFYQAAVELL